MNATTTDVPLPATPPRRGRRWLRWIVAFLLVLLALPFLIYGGALLYISAGYLNGEVASRVGAIFDAPATVGGVSTHWLQDFRVENIQIEARDKGKPFSIGAVSLDYDLQQLYDERRIRTVTIDRPALTLKRDDKGAWNFGLKPASPTAPRIIIEQIALNEGDVSVEWSPGHSARLQSLSATFADKGPQAAMPFSVKGFLESKESVALNGELGPGNAWSAKLGGGLFLERDLAALTGPSSLVKGRVRFQLAAKNATPPAKTASRALNFDGSVSLENVVWPADAPQGSTALHVLEKTATLRGRLSFLAPAVNGAPIPGKELEIESYALDEFTLTVPGVGSLSGSSLMKLEPSTVIVENGRAEFEIAAVRKLFQPELLGEMLDIDGKLAIDGIALSLPIGKSDTVPQAAATIQASGARLKVRGMGALPPLDIKAALKWPAVTNASVTVGDLATVSFGLKDITPGPDPWSSIAKGAEIHDLRADLGKLLESDLGRRLLTGILDESKQPPALADLPFSVKGMLQAPNLKTTVTEPQNHKSTITFSAVKLQDLSIVKWPLPFKVPAKVFIGEIEQSIVTIGAPTAPRAGLQKLEFNGKVTTTTAKTDPPTEFTAALETDDKGNWQPGLVQVNRLAVPLPDLDAIFSFSQSTGVSGTGNIVVEEAQFHPVTGRLSGTVTLEEALLKIPIPAELQGLMIEAIKLTKFAAAAPILKANPIQHIALQNVNLRLKLNVNDGRMMLRGRTQDVFLKAPIPYWGDAQVWTFKPVDISVEMDLPGKPERSGNISLAWAGPNRLNFTFKESTRNKWHVSGSFETTWFGGLTLAFETPVDLNTHNAGPLALSFSDQDLEKVVVSLKQLGLPAFTDLPTMKGKLNQLKVEVDAVDYQSLSMEKIPNARITGTIQDAALAHAQAELEGLTGQFILGLASDGKGLASNARLSLESYEALLARGAFYIPKGKDGAIHLVSKINRSEDGRTQIRVDKAEINLGQNVEFAASGLIATAPDGALATIALDKVSLNVPDMAVARAIYGPDNLQNRAPWFGDIGLAGPGSFSGKFDWAPAKVALTGKVGFAGSTIALGKTVPVSFTGLSGEIPVNLSVGGAETPASVAGRLKIASMRAAELQAPAQELVFSATPNALRLSTPYEIRVPSGTVSVSGVEVLDLLKPNAAPEIALKLGMRVDLTDMLKNQGVTINGMEGCVLSGVPLDCRMTKTSDDFGGTWRLTTSGGFRAPFFGADIVVENLRARGLFGPAPVFGGDIRIANEKEGVKVTQILDKNPQFGMGKFHIRANVAVTGIEAATLGLDGIQAATIDVDSVDFKDNDFWYDGTFAMKVNYPLVRASFPKFFFPKDDDIAKLTFGVRRLSLQYVLKDGFLIGPRPKLPGDLILEGYGTETNPFGDRFKKDIKAEYNEKLREYGTRVPWATIVKGLSH